MESGEFDETTAIHTAPGYFRVGTKLVEDPVNRGTISLAEALQKSSQVGIAKVALALPERAIYNVLARSGLGEYIGTGLPGEVVGVLSDANITFDGSVWLDRLLDFGLCKLASTNRNFLCNYWKLKEKVILNGTEERRRTFALQSLMTIVKLQKTVSLDISKDICEFLLGMLENGVGSFQTLQSLYKSIGDLFQEESRCKKTSAPGKKVRGFSVYDVAHSVH